jgi:hypothetical protein
VIAPFPASSSKAGKDTGERSRAGSAFRFAKRKGIAHILFGRTVAFGAFRLEALCWFTDLARENTMDHTDPRPAVGLPPLPMPGLAVPAARPTRTRFRSGSGFSTVPGHPVPKN